MEPSACPVSRWRSGLPDSPPSTTACSGCPIVSGRLRLRHDVSRVVASRHVSVAVVHERWLHRSTDLGGVRAASVETTGGRWRDGARGVALEDPYRPVPFFCVGSGDGDGCK